MEEIKRVNLEHCIEVLRHNKLSVDAEKFTTVKTERHFKILEESTNLEEKKSYDFLTKAGAVFQDFVFKLCKIMIKEESFPTRFSRTTLYNLWKRKGSRKNLNNHRYIHLNDWLP